MKFNGSDIDKIMFDGQQVSKAMLNGDVLLNRYPLDSIDNAAAVYSVNKLRASQTNALRVRRSRDNTTRDIGFMYNGTLDTTALLSFCGSGSGYVNRWYDQSGLGNDALQTTPANQPRIVNAGTMDNGLYFDGTDDYLDITNSESFNITAAPMTFLTEMKVASELASNAYVFCKNTSSSADVQFGYIYYVGTTAASANLEATSYSGQIITVNTMTKCGFTWQTGGTLIYYNNAEIVETTSCTATLTSRNAVSIGRRVGGTPFKGNMKQIALFKRALSSSEIVML